MQEGPWVFNPRPNEEMTNKHGMKSMQGNDLGTSNKVTVLDSTKNATGRRERKYVEYVGD